MADKATDDTMGTLETKVEEVVAPVVDEFTDAFKEADKVGDRADLSAADDPANKKEELPVVVLPVVTPPVVETPPIETPPIEQQPGETEEKFEQRYKTLQGIHKHDRETWEIEKTKLLFDLEEAKKPKTPEVIPSPEKVAANTFVDSLTDDQKERLKVYERDFDMVSEMEGIKRGTELGKLKKEMMDTIQTWKDEFITKLTETETNITSRIAPAVKLVEDNDQENHFSMIREGYVREDGTSVPGHNDFEKFRDDGSLSAWIESKPKYLQPALKETYSKGSATDVIDLISDFKKDNNIPLTSQPSADVIPINTAKAAKKQALSTVTSRGRAVNLNVAVADDFEGAFNEAIHK